MARAGAGRRAGGGVGALIPRARLTNAEKAAKAAAKAARRDLIPSPRSKRAQRTWQKWLPDTEEVRWLQRANLTETLAGGSGEYLAELRKIATGRQRAAYNAQQRARRAAKPKKKPSRIRVRAHWRGVPK